MNKPRIAITDLDDIKRTRRFIIRLGKTMHEYGTTSYRLENLLTETTHLLGLNGTFLITPTTMNFVFWEDGSEDEITHIARVTPGGIDLNRLSLTHALTEQVLSGQVSLDKGIETLHEIRNSPDLYSKKVELLTWGVASGSFAALCGTGILDTLAAMVAGFLVYLLVYASTKIKRIEEMLEPMAALLVGFLASGAAAAGLQINAAIVILAGVIVFIPGLSLTLGLRELAARDLVSGTARIMDSIMTLFKLYFGAAFGLALGTLLWNISPHVAVPSMPSWVHYLAVLVLSSSLLVMFKIRHRDAIWALLAGFIAYTSAEVGNHLFGAELGALLGAMVVGVYANAYASIRNTPSHIVLMPGIVLLVPGSKAYMGLSSLVTGQEILTNSASGGQIFLTFMALIAGLMFSNVILPPQHRL